MDKLFNKTPTSNFAALALAGIMASGYMVYEAGKPVVMALVGGQVAGAKIAAMIKPMAQPEVKSTAKVEPKSATVATIKQEVNNVTNKVEQLAQTNQTKNDAVLGTADESSSISIREEFPPAVNLLRNSSFEEDSNLAPRQWNYQYDSNSGNSFTTAEAIRTGTKGLKFVGGGTGNYGISQPATKLIERRPYALSLWVKPVNTDAHTVKLSFWDEVNNKEAASKTFSFSGTKEWSRLVLQVSNKNNWNGKKWFPMVTVNGLGAGALYIDDVQLEEASSFTPYHFTGGGSTQAHVSILGDGSVEVDAHGKPKEIIASQPPVIGKDIVLTIDLDLQKKLAESLARASLDAHSSGAAAAVAINPENGEILALVSLPDFDNNFFSAGIQAEAYEKYLADDGFYSA